MLSRSYWRVLSGGKGSKRVAILFPRSLQKLIEVLLILRDKCIPNNYEYLFAHHKSVKTWLSGYHTLLKLNG